MDIQPFQPEEPLPGYVEPSQEGYDEAVLGVECAWPTPEREELIAHH